MQAEVQKVKPRLDYLDIGKGLTILYIVMYHLIYPSCIKTLFMWLASPAMFFLFFVSGFTYAAGKRTIRDGIAKRARQLLLTFLIYSLVLMGIALVRYTAIGDTTLQDIPRCLASYFSGAIWNRQLQNFLGLDYMNVGKRFVFLAPYWYLLSMFGAIVVFIPLVEKLQDKTKSLKICTAVCVLISLILVVMDWKLPYNLHLAFLFAGLMIGGFLVRNSDLPGKIAEMKTGAKGLIAGAAFSINVLLFQITAVAPKIFRADFSDEALGEHSVVIGYIVVLIQAVLGVASVGVTALLLDEAGKKAAATAEGTPQPLVQRFLIFCGRNSMEIFLLHQFFAWFLGLVIGYSLVIPRDQEFTCGLLLKSILRAALSILYCCGFIALKTRLKKNSQK